MKQQVIKGFILGIIFGVPIIWYLFLQVFGENKFELEPIRMLNETCSIAPNKVYLAKMPASLDEENQLNRLKFQLKSRGELVQEGSVQCISDTAQFPLYMIDDKQQLRGMYDLTILDVDRLIVEIDLIKEME